MNKSEARQYVKGQIAKMSEPEKEWASDAIVDQVIALDVFKKAKKVFCFISVDNEPNSRELIGLSLALEKRVSVPRTKGSDMSAIIITPYTDFYKNKYGIEEPLKGQEEFDFDLIIVPMVGFDQLDRLGHGKGFYDKFLSTGKAHDAIKIGIAFDCQEVAGLEVDPCDVPLDMVVTEKRVITKKCTKTNEFFE